MKRYDEIDRGKVVWRLKHFKRTLSSTLTTINKSRGRHQRHIILNSYWGRKAEKIESKAVLCTWTIKIIFWRTVRHIDQILATVWIQVVKMDTIEIINSSRLSGRYTYTSSSSSRKSHSSKLLRRNLRTDNLTRSKSSITMMCLMVSSICIILFASFTTSNAFVPPTSSRITIISSRTPSKSTSEAMSSTQLQVAKTGGKLISTEQEFSDNVLSKDLSRPVLVFFTAPW